MSPLCQRLRRRQRHFIQRFTVQRRPGTQRTRLWLMTTFGWTMLLETFLFRAQPQALLLDRNPGLLPMPFLARYRPVRPSRYLTRVPLFPPAIATTSIKSFGSEEAGMGA